MRFLLPFLPHALVVALIAGLIWWIDDNAADRTRDQIAAQAAQAEIRLRADLRTFEGRLGDKIALNGAQVSGQISDLGALHRTIIQPTLIKELSRETRMSDPAAGITDGVRKELNRALAAVACAPRPDGGIRCTLPERITAAEQ